jgi:hypothetical protein
MQVVSGARCSAGGLTRTCHTPVQKRVRPLLQLRDRCDFHARSSYECNLYALDERCCRGWSRSCISQGSSKGIEGWTTISSAYCSFSFRLSPRTSIVARRTPIAMTRRGHGESSRTVVRTYIVEPRGTAGKRSSESTCCGLGRATGPSVQGFAPRPRQRPSHTSTPRRALPPEIHRLRSLNTQAPSNERSLQSRVETWLEDTDPRPLTEEEGGRAMSYSGSTSLQEDRGEGTQMTPARFLRDWTAESVPYQRSPETGAASTTQTQREVRSSAKAYAGPT